LRDAGLNPLSQRLSLVLVLVLLLVLDSFASISISRRRTRRIQTAPGRPAFAFGHAFFCKKNWQNEPVQGKHFLFYHA